MLDPYQQHSGYLEEERFESATKNSLNKKTVLGKKKKAGIDLIIFLFSILEFSLEEYIKHFKQMEHPFPWITVENSSFTPERKACSHGSLLTSIDLLLSFLQCLLSWIKNTTPSSTTASSIHQAKVASKNLVQFWSSPQKNFQNHHLSAEAKKNQHSCSRRRRNCSKTHYRICIQFRHSKLICFLFFYCFFFPLKDWSSREKLCV